MFKKCFLLVVFMVSALSFTARADMYAIYDIHVDVTAQNATKAKEQGVTEAQEKAFYKMLERLTLPSNVAALPVLTTEDILNLVQDFSVSHEKTSSVRYIADVDVQFNPEAIQTFFQEYQVPYVTSVADKSVVIPVYFEQPNAPALLWQDRNPWGRILAQAASTSDLVPFVVPVGDLDDMAVLNENNWANESELDLTPMMQRYKTTNALVAEMTVLREQNMVRLTLRSFQNKDGFLEAFTIFEPIDAPLPAVMRRMADKMVQNLEQRWREQNAVRFDNPTELEVSVHIQNLAEWIAIRKKLDNIKLIKQYVVKALKRDEAEIEVFFAGDLKPFKAALRKESLFLSPLGESGWRLRDLKDVPEAEIIASDNQDKLELNAFEKNASAEQTDQNVPATASVDALEPSLNIPEDFTTFTQEKVSAITDNDVKTFDLSLYQQVERQPETLQMLEEMRQQQMKEKSNDENQ